MAKPNKKAPVAVPTQFNPQLAVELTNLKRLTSKAVDAVEADGKITVSVKVLDSSINALTLTRALLKDADAEKKAAIAKVIPAEVQQAVKAIETEAKRIKTDATEQEALLAAALNAEVEAGRITENMTSEHGCQLILQHRKALVIDDEAALPEAFTKRVPDMVAIEKALTEWEVKVDAAKTLDLPPPPCPVPGAHIGEKIVLVTKAPELIEE